METQIQNDIKAAMIAKDKVALTSLRAIKAAILLAKTAEGASGAELTEQEIVKIIQKLVKQRKESAAIYSQQNRPELAESEIAEATVMEKYLPKALSEDEVINVIKQIKIGRASCRERV